MVVQSERIFRLGTMASNNLQSLELYPFDEKEIEFGGKRRKKKEKKKRKEKGDMEMIEGKQIWLKRLLD